MEMCRVHLGVSSIAAPLTSTSPYTLRLSTMLHINSAKMARDIQNVHGVLAGNKSNGTTVAQATKYRWEMQEGDLVLVGLALVGLAQRLSTVRNCSCPLQDSHLCSVLKEQIVCLQCGT